MGQSFHQCGASLAAVTGGSLVKSAQGVGAPRMSYGRQVARMLRIRSAVEAFEAYRLKHASIMGFYKLLHVTPACVIRCQIDVR